jgi:hypothetical protein
VLPAMWAGVAASQQISGAVRFNGSSVALDETSVVLVDSAGAVVAITTTGSNGNFTLRAPAPGTYRIRARRIGFLPDSSRYLTLTVGQQSQQINLSLNAFPVRLVRVGIEEARRCVIAPQAGAAVFRLWQEAQSALTATVATSHDVNTGFALRRFERKLDPRSGQIEESRSWDSRAATSEPYASIPAESLAAHGYVVPDGRMLVYYAPDARTLISDAFARTHCFHPTEDRSRQRLIGLAFEPTEQRSNDRSVRDVSGTLWFDRASLDLQALDFEYGGNSAHAPDASAAATGHLDYRRLPNGSWIVSHWLIHMPVITVTTTVTAPNGLASEPGGITLSRNRAQDVTSIWEAGGDVRNVLTLTAALDSAVIASAYGAVGGSVVDTTSSGARKGISGVRVTLERSRTAADSARLYSALTDSSGSFVIDSVTPDTYFLRMGSARLDTLGIDIVKRSVAVGPATQQSFVTIIPTTANAIYNMCRSSLGSREGLLHGLVSNSTGDPVEHVRIDVSWFAIADSRQEHFAASTHNIAAFSDGHGMYLICGIPRGQPLKILARDGATGRTASTVRTQNALVGMENFVLPGAAPLHAEHPRP